MSRAFLLKTNGIAQEIELLSFAQIQQLCGGDVERLQLADGNQMWLDEEGKPKGYPINHGATRMTRNIGLDPADLIVGDVVITGPYDEDGDYTDITQGFVATLFGVSPAKES